MSLRKEKNKTFLFELVAELISKLFKSQTWNKDFFVLIKDDFQAILGFVDLSFYLIYHYDAL